MKKQMKTSCSICQLVFKTSLYQILYSGESFRESILPILRWQTLQFVFIYFIFVGTTCFSCVGYLSILYYCIYDINLCGGIVALKWCVCIMVIIHGKKLRKHRNMVRLSSALYTVTAQVIGIIAHKRYDHIYHERLNSLRPSEAYMRRYKYQHWFR